MMGFILIVMNYQVQWLLSSIRKKGYNEGEITIYTLQGIGDYI